MSPGMIACFPLESMALTSVQPELQSLGIVRDVIVEGNPSAGPAW